MSLTSVCFRIRSLNSNFANSGIKLLHIFKVIIYVKKITLKIVFASIKWILKNKLSEKNVFFFKKIYIFSVEFEMLL